MSGMVHVEGLDSATRALSRLEMKARKRIVAAAVRAGGKELLKAARADAPQDKGFLAKQLRISVKKDTRKGTATATVKAKQTKSQRRKGMTSRATVLHLIVGGTQPHTIPGPVQLPTGGWYSNVEHPGTQANPFLDRAARRATGASIKAFSKRFGEKLEAEARRGKT